MLLMFMEKGFLNKTMWKHWLIHTVFKLYQFDVFGVHLAVGDPRNINSGDKPYACDIYGKFSYPDVMSENKLVHIGIEPCKCDVCSKYFTWSNTGNIQSDPQHYTSFT